MFSLWDIFKENIILIMPDEPADSYELAKCSDLNFVYHSSIGAEIMALGRHVYSLNSCRYIIPTGTVVNDTHHMSQIIRANFLSKPQQFDSTISRNGLEYLYSASNFGESFFTINQSHLCLVPFWVFIYNFITLVI